MKQPSLTAAELKNISALVQYYEDNKRVFESLVYQLNGHIEASDKLKELVHSVKGRVKDPAHLYDKLVRKGLEHKINGRSFPYSKENLFKSVNDLAGFRILHLHTKQVKDIDKELQRIFEEQRWILLEGPAARTWDDESKQYFKDIGFDTVDSESMYTSVHYVVQPNSRSETTCEIQVRTLMEEVWGEVDHKINYPKKSESESCKEQIKVLARVTSSCSRLVDSIFLSHNHVISEKSSTPRRKGRGGMS
ncbi:RelA/SpoT domain-containing protein [Xanthomonas arboricola]|uniref:RelA/SpoT domain-containing protein n=1 Tax=Xanthomonas arboricola TaxID=56448 RepID=UPI0009BC2950|nr:RelA/SpoT domain-containing protein [Xanthomonas arboricola]